MHALMVIFFETGCFRFRFAFKRNFLQNSLLLGAIDADLATVDARMLLIRGR